MSIIKDINGVTEPINFDTRYLLKFLPYVRTFRPGRSKCSCRTDLGRKRPRQRTLRTKRLHVWVTNVVKQGNGSGREGPGYTDVGVPTQRVQRAHNRPDTHEKKKGRTDVSPWRRRKDLGRVESSEFKVGVHFERYECRRVHD